MIRLYSTNPPCPKCKVLHQKLVETGRTFETIEDTDVLIEKGFQQAPILEIDGRFMDFSEAIAWIKG